MYVQTKDSLTSLKATFTGHAFAAVRISIFNAKETLTSSSRAMISVQKKLTSKCLVKPPSISDYL